jgi:hypothetical protein
LIDMALNHILLALLAAIAVAVPLIACVFVSVR